MKLIEKNLDSMQVKSTHPFQDGGSPKNLLHYDEDAEEINMNEDLELISKERAECSQQPLEKEDELFDWAKSELYSMISSNKQIPFNE